LTDSKRIFALTQSRLVKVKTDASGWDTLYRDPTDGRFWELIYPQSHLHGGGPPELRNLTPDDAKQKYAL
jgi:Immunity protein 27